MSHFFSEKESQAIVKAIADIELHSAGEIRVHVEDLCAESPVDRAIEVFNKLEMYRTADRTGVLIFVATEDHKLAIVGDIGIHTKLGDHYWQNIAEEMKEKCKNESIFASVLYGVVAVGEKLKVNFPENQKPENELTNEISYGKI